METIKKMKQGLLRGSAYSWCSTSDIPDGARNI